MYSGFDANNESFCLSDFLLKFFNSSLVEIMHIFITFFCHKGNKFFNFFLMIDNVLFKKFDFFVSMTIYILHELDFG